MNDYDILSECPCGNCPLFYKCQKHGDVNPISCKYIDEWYNFHWTVLDLFVVFLIFSFLFLDAFMFWINIHHSVLLKELRKTYELLIEAEQKEVLLSEE